MLDVISPAAVCSSLLHAHNLPIVRYSMTPQRGSLLVNMWIPWWHRNPHDPVISQRPHLNTTTTLGPSCQHMNQEDVAFYIPATPMGILSVHVHICSCWCVCRCVCVHMSVEVRGQPWVSFLSHYPLCWDIVSSWIGVQWFSYAVWLVNPKKPPVSSSPGLGLHTAMPSSSFLNGCWGMTSAPVENLSA